MLHRLFSLLPCVLGLAVAAFGTIQADDAKGQDNAFDLKFADSKFHRLNGRDSFNAFYAGDPAVLEIHLSNAAARFVRIRLQDTWQPLGIADGPVFDQTYPVDQVPFAKSVPLDTGGRLGAWQVVSEALNADKKPVATGPALELVVVKPAEPAPADPSVTYFGTTETVHDDPHRAEFFHRVLGIHNVSTGIVWSALEPHKKGSFDLTAANSAKKWLDTGFYAMMCAYMTPLWAAYPDRPNRHYPGADYSFGPPRDLQDFADYLKAANGMISAEHPHQFAWRLWNEPDELFWDGTTKEFVDTMQVYYRTLKGLDPSMPLVGCDPTGLGFIKQVCDLGGASYCDIFGIHTYMANNPEEAGLEQKISNLSALRDQFAPGKPLWDTEYNFKGDGEPAGGEAGQAFQLVRGHVLMLKGGISKFFWYGVDFDDGGISSIRAPAVAAFNQQSRMIDQAKYLETVDVHDVLKNFTRCYAFARGDSVRVVLWRMGQPTRLHLTGSGHCQAYDLYGNEIKLEGADRAITISHRPVYLTFPTTELASMRETLRSAKVDPVENEFKDSKEVKIEVVPLQKKLADRPALNFKIMLSASLPEGGRFELTKLPQGWKTNVATAEVVPKNISEGEYSVNTAEFVLEAAPRNEYNNALFEDKTFPVSYRLTAANGKVLEGQKLLTWQVCVYTSTPPIIDGDIAADWKDALPTVLGEEVHEREKSWANAKETVWSGTDDLSASFYSLWDENNFYIAVKVTDDKHVQTGKGWLEDSVQLGLGDDFNPLFYLQDGVPHFEDLPPDTKMAAKRTGNTTTYELAIPLAHYPFVKPQPGGHLGINILLNDEDADGRGRRIIEYSEGISTNKDTSKYQPWTFLK